jgi:alpha-D-ribose 1-methylphosphonate 5-phosphate C-P lyase
MTGKTIAGYNFAYLDAQTKRMIRRAILKAVAIPGHQIPFGSREMPLPYGWGTGGIQVTASIIGADDTLKVIDQGADDTTNAVSIRSFFSKTAGVKTTESTSEATVIQTRHRIPETPLTEGQILVYQVLIRSRCAGSSRARSRRGRCTPCPSTGRCMSSSTNRSPPSAGSRRPTTIPSWCTGAT